MNVSRIGPFAIEERLGGDATSTVFRAVHIQQRRSCALRIFPASLVASTPAARKALQQEFELLKQLKHPGIVRCYGGALEANQGYLAYELVDGESLSALLERRERLSWEQVVEYSGHVCDALEYTHQLGITHQALTPDKLIVSTDGHVRISDFRQDRQNNPWCHSAVKKTAKLAEYRAPEQFKRDATIGPKADLYAVGCIMFRMLTGRLPFEGASFEQIAEQHLSAAAPVVSTIVFECPVWLDTLIAQLLEKDPLRRPHSASMVSRALLETHQIMASKTSVAEHLAAGFSPLTARVDKTEARELIHGKKKKKRSKSGFDDEAEDGPIYERPWFLATCLMALLVSVIAFVMWPASEEKLYRHAKSLMESEDEVDWQEARDSYLQPMLERFPSGQHASWAREQLDKLDMSLAEKRLRNKIRFGRSLSNCEQLLAEAWNYEQFGDRLTALEKYESMVDLFDTDETERPFVNIARRQMVAIEKDRGRDRGEYLQKQLDRADALASDGNEIEARKIWKSIVSLYSGKRELASFVAKAEARLEKKSVDAPPSPQIEERENVP